MTRIPCLAAGLAVAAMIGLLGCAGRAPHALDAAGTEALSKYGEKAAERDKSHGPADRFEALPRQPASADGPADGSATAPAPGDPAAEAPGAAPPGPLPRKSSSRLAGFVDPLTRTADRVPVTLESCLRRALANNLSIQIARFGPAIARTVVAEAEALFDPSWFLNNALGRIRQDSGTALAGATTLIAKEWDFATGVDTLLPTGGTVALAQDWTYINSNSQFFTPNPQYASGLGLSVRQPLLRQAGVEVTRSPIVLARLDHSISLSDFSRRLMDTLLEVETAYWTLVVAETQVQALTEALDAAKENQRIAQRRFEEGKDKRVIVSLADSAVTSRETDLVVARLRL
ncbi:MAG: TolC family protein, partial [Acidobacteria bacterium]|nr:TolC family protein [Acidobacteriota bacterium]